MHHPPLSESYLVNNDNKSAAYFSGLGGVRQYLLLANGLIEPCETWIYSGGGAPLLPEERVCREVAAESWCTY